MGTKCHYQAPCQQISNIPLRMWPNLPPRTGTTPHSNPVAQLCWKYLLFWCGFFSRCPSPPSCNRVESSRPHMFAWWQSKNLYQKRRGSRERGGDSTGSQGAPHELQSLSGQLLLPSEKSLQKGQGLVFSFIGRHHKVQELLLTNEKPCQEPLAH